MKKTLDKFTAAYVEAALWSSTDGDEHPLDDNYTADDIADDTLAVMVADCEKFQRENAVLLGGEDKLGGYDFWLTRNGHGAGFWDGDWPEQIGDALTNAAHAFGSFDLYVGDDGKIYGN